VGNVEGGEGPAAPSEPPSASGPPTPSGPPTASSAAPAARATTQPVTPDVAVPVVPPRRRRRQRRAAAAANGAKGRPKSKIPSLAATTAVTAVITAIVGGILSQDRIDSVLGDDEPTDSSSAGTMEDVEFERVSDPAGAIAVDVPRSWGATEARFDGIGGVTSPGLGLRAGPDPMEVRFVVDETVWVGASTQAFDDLGLTGLDDATVVDLFEGRLESSVYLPRNDCSPTSKHTPELGDQWVGAVQAWQDCSSIDGWRAIEVEMISSDRDVYVYLQIGLAPSTPDEVAQRMLDSLDVLPAKLPVS